MILTLLGGIGLFLLGMTLLTDGLKSLAGDALRQILSKFVKGPFSALSSGTLVTVLVQSSSATTLATIGFVSAGILTFPQTIGVLLGAKLGTTSTGWIVATLGLKFSISVIALPVIGVGAFMRLLSKGRIAQAGMALAGFGLIFVGIDTLQAGMGELRSVIDLSAYSGNTITGVMLLVFTGIIMTVIMQSSSAAVATTLTALFAGAIDVSQAAALVIGQNFGTSVTALIAIIGASTAAVRTGISYIVFGAVIAAIALVLMPVFIHVTNLMQIADDVGALTIAIAIFHTGFNLAGVLLIMPFRHYFTEMIERWVPEKELSLTRHLDRSVQNIPSVAIETVNRTLQDILKNLLMFLKEVIETPQKMPDKETVEIAERAIEEVNLFINGINVESYRSAEYNRYVATLHALDHTTRFIDACKEFQHVSVIVKDPVAVEMAETFTKSIHTSLEWIDSHEEFDLAGTLEKTSNDLALLRKKRRVEILEMTAGKKESSTHILQILDAIRWIDRLAYHNWRALYHLLDLREYKSDPPFPS